jgi:hypothetical protein
MLHDTTQHELMNYDAVNQVTRALRMLLHRQLAQVSTSAVVTLLPPGDQLPASAGVNLYLYRVMESPFTRNQPWRGDRDTPPSMQPALGLQLYYLLTPLGAQPDPNTPTLGDDAHTMLGIAMQTFFENSILNEVHFPDFDADAVLPPPLRDSYEQIKIILLPSSLDELSKIWSTINQPYRLSVAYEVSLVELTPSVPPAAGGGAVASIGLDVVALGAPDVTQLVPPTGALSSIVAGGLQGNRLQILGSGLASSFSGQPPVVQVGGQTVTVVVPSPPDPSGQSLLVTLPPDTDAGPEVNIQVSIGNQTSIPQIFLVTPWLAQIKPVRTALDPALGNSDLTLSLIGKGFGTSPQAVRFEVAGGSVVAAPPSSSSDALMTVHIPSTLPNGVYRVRLVRGDGGASNSRMIEVVPLINQPIAAIINSPPGTPICQLTINGARLNGQNISLRIDDTTYQVAPDPNDATQGKSPSQIVARLGRALDPGTHTIAVNVDGHQSRTVLLEV